MSAPVKYQAARSQKQLKKNNQKLVDHEKQMKSVRLKREETWHYQKTGAPMYFRIVYLYKHENNNNRKENKT